jgi:hypothetical protein
MKHTAFFFLIILGFMPLLCKAQENYTNYWKTFYNAEQYVIENKYQLALECMDTLNNNYSKMYSSHSYFASRIAVLSNDTNRALKFIRRSITNGIPLRLIKADTFLIVATKYKQWERVERDYDSLRNIYLKRINKKLRVQIDSMITIDQDITNKINNSFLYFFKWRKVCRRNAKLLNKIILENGYPGEFLIGLSNFGSTYPISKQDKIYINYAFQEAAVRTMLIHYFSYKEPYKELNKILLFEVVKGNLPSNYFASFLDFQSKWRKDKEYYNEWHSDPCNENIEFINERRKAIGLNSYEQKLIINKYNKNILTNKLYYNLLFLW